MTVSTEVDHNEYTGNGVTTTFPYKFRIFKKSDLVVQVVDINENINVLVLDTDYIVTGAGGYSGGNVILSKALANGHQISISRELPATQETDLRNQGKFFAEVHEDAFDKLTMLIQQCFSFLRLSLRKPSFIANYYDALNNRIRNLRDPSQAQDAATKNYVDESVAGSTSHSDDLFKRTLRVPENYLDMAPPIHARRNSLLGWNNSGNPIPVFSMTETADLAIKLASSEDGLGDSLVTHVKDGVFTGSLHDFLNSTIQYVTPELMGYNVLNSPDDNAASILEALTVARENNLVCKFQNGTYNSNDLEVNFPVSIDVSPTAFLDFALVVRGGHFDVVKTVRTTLDWSAVPSGTTSIAGDFSAFDTSNAVAVSLNNTDGGSASEGNETGSDFSLISAKDDTSLTLATPTRFAYLNPDVSELRAAVQYSGTLAADEYFISGDYTALFQIGDIVRIENISGTYAVEASPYYFELAKIHSISTAGIALKARLNYTHVNPWIVKTSSVPGVKVSGGGRIKRLEIRQCDTPNIMGLSIDRLITSFSYDVDVADINSVGVSEPSTANFSYCFGRSKASNIRVGGSSSVTDNAALKFMSCPKMQFNGITSDNTTATGTQGDYGVFGDAYFTPYYCWNKGTAVNDITVEKPRSTVNRAVWFYGLRDSVVSNIKGGQVFLQGCVNSAFTDIVIPEEPLEVRDLVSCNVTAFCKASTLLGNIDCDFTIKTTGVGNGASANIACRFGSGVRNPLTGETYTIGRNNKITLNSLSTSTSAITIQAQAQDGLIIGAGCRDKSTVAQSIVFSASDVTNPGMEPNKLKGAMASGSGWVGCRQKGGIHFDGDYRDGFIRIGSYWFWITGSGVAKAAPTKPTSDSPADQIIIGP
ncbi:TPA: hypothetical protein ACPE0R_001120 [Escherichia coli]|uniref:hypothetical protein n=1 Tax=Escherichia coli TaxID=562 RepID=UPI001E594103|nr:hypothetical protein [Escherichia coli]